MTKFFWQLMLKMIFWIMYKECMSSYLVHNSFNIHSRVKNLNKIKIPSKSFNFHLISHIVPQQLEYFSNFIDARQDTLMCIYSIENEHHNKIIFQVILSLTYLHLEIDFSIEIISQNGNQLEQASMWTASEIIIQKNFQLFSSSFICNSNNINW